MGWGSGCERRADREPAWRHLAPHAATRPRHAAPGPQPRGQHALPRPHKTAAARPRSRRAATQRRCTTAPAAHHPRARARRARAHGRCPSARRQPSAQVSPKAGLAQGRAGPRQAAAVPAAPALRVPAPVRHYLLNLALPRTQVRGGGPSSRSSSRSSHSTWTRRPSRTPSERRPQRPARSAARLVPARPALNRGRSAVTARSQVLVVPRLSLCGCVLLLLSVSANSVLTR